MISETQNEITAVHVPGDHLVANYPQALIGVNRAVCRTVFTVRSDFNTKERIHDFDFSAQENFTDGERLINQLQGVDSPSDTRWLRYGNVSGIAYGDLNGDGKDEAAISASFADENGRQVTIGFVYSMGKRAPSLLAAFEVGEQAPGVTCKIEIHRGLLHVEQFGNLKSNRAGDSSLTQTQVYRLRNRKLVHLNKIQKPRPDF